MWGRGDIFIVSYLFNKMGKDWFVYLVECKNGNLYTGITNDLDKRMHAHSTGKGSKYVIRNGFGKLLSSKKCENRSEASKEEYRIKQLNREEKLRVF